MANTGDTGHLADLRVALGCSPDNVPLRRILAERLLAAGELEQAETEFKKALQHDPDEPLCKLGLSKACHAQGKLSLAVVLLEHLLQLPQPPKGAREFYRSIVKKSERLVEAVEPVAEPDDDDIWFDPDDPDGEDFLMDGRMRQAHDEPDAEFLTELQRPEIDFSSVGGMENVKDEVRIKIILPLTNKELYQAYGKGVGGGILLYGPPGCGKTHLARATAGEVKAGFLSVGLNDVLDMWIGQSEQKLHAIFEHARRNKPCVLFFDEVDALGASRTDLKKSAGRQLINQFLSELDGINADNEGLLILAATNAPWHLDSAFRRPGRFDRIIFVPPPDESARGEILRLEIEGKPTGAIDPTKLAGRLREFSGADIKALVDTAVEDKLREAMKVGQPLPIEMRDLVKAAKRVRPSTKEWLATARNYALYSNEGGIYDDILDYLKLR